MESINYCIKRFCQNFLLLTSAFGLVTINFGISLTAQAAISCESGTVNYYPNGSLATCLLTQNVNVEVSSSFWGTSNFPCKAKNYISFDQKGQFYSCQLSKEIQIKSGNVVDTCAAEYQVQVTVLDTGVLAITCQP